MTKRILSLLLAALMVLGTLVVVSAAEPDYTAENTWAVEVLSKIKVLQGDENGDPMLDNAILRYEMALFLGRALTGYTDDAYWAKVENETPFDDLLVHPYNGVCTWNYNHGIILGVNNKVFNPNGNITYQDAIVMVVRAWADYYVKGNGLSALGFVDELHYPWKHIELAKHLGLLANIDPDEVFLENTSRGVVAQLVYNLLTWDYDNYNGYLSSSLWDKDSLGKEYFGLQISAKTGDIVEVKAIANDGKVTTEKAIAGLTKATFEQFDTEAKVGSTYKIVYYTVGNETVVTSLVKVSTDAAAATNTPAAKEYELVYEACKWNDKGEATMFKVTGLKIGETTYALLGKDAITLKIYDRSKTAVVVDKALLEGVDGSDEGTETDGITKAELAEVLKFGMPEYSKVKVLDTNKDGKVDTLEIVPYVFAALYTEVAIKGTDGKDTKATEWVLTGYGVVAITDAVLTTKTTDYFTRTWTGWETKDASGNKKTEAITAKTAEFVAKSSVTTLETAKKFTAATLDAYDLRDAKDVTKYIKLVGEDTLFGYGYKDLLGWDIYVGTNGVATYFDLARVDAASKKPLGLLELYNNKNVDDKKVTGNKYINVWVINDNVVALEAATKDGEGTGTTTPTEPTVEKYTGILVVTNKGNALPDKANIFRNATVGSGNDKTDLVKVVNGKYYLVIEAKVNGAKKDILVYLADATTFALNSNSSLNSDTQFDNWNSAENAKIQKGYELVLANGKNVAFYTVDESGNYVLVPNAADKFPVNGVNYQKHVAGSFVVAEAAKGDTLGTAFTYVMDRNAFDFIEYDYTTPTVADDPATSVDESKAGGTTKKFIEGVADKNTSWLFVTANDIQVETGAPEYKSTFTVDARTDIVKVDDTLVVFEDAARAGFKYTMFEGASYALYNGEASLDYMVRDGYLYFTVADFLTGEDVLICVPENGDLAKKLADYAEKNTKVIIAVDAEEDAAHQNAHVLLGEYQIEGGAIAAIASLEYGKSAFEATGITTEAALVNRIAQQYNLNRVDATKMVGVIYNVSGGTIVEDTDGTLANGTIYVFFAAANGTTPASYVAFVVPAV